MTARVLLFSVSGSVIGHNRTDIGGVYFTLCMRRLSCKVDMNGLHRPAGW